MLTRAVILSQRIVPITTRVRANFNRSFSSLPSSSVLPNDRICFVAPGEAATRYLASHFASDLRPGDCYCLLGEVGAGKSVFSRAFIREAEEDEELPVPSPTYLLQELYGEHAGPPIHHFDMYRLDPSQNKDRLNLAESYRIAVSLIEWADRLQDLPPERLDIYINILSASDKAQMKAITAEEPRVVQPDEDESAYVDKEWRKICLQPVGEAWRDRVNGVMHSITASSAHSTGLIMMPGVGSKECH